MNIKNVIRVYGAPSLTRKSRAVDFDKDIEIVTELRAVAEKIFKKTRALGVAAPQLGVNLRVFFVNNKELPDFGEINTMINPELKIHGGDKTNDEGCLSFPGLIVQIPRARFSDVEGIRPSGKRFVLINLKELPARLVQHEVDHLDGKLFISKLSLIKRRMLKKYLNSLIRAEAKRKQD